ncbi:MAG: GyrI-like domain-containing protein [Candidatus Thorarchaeota archaeon]
MTLKEDTDVRMFIQMYKDEISLMLSSIANERRLEILSIIYKTPAEFNEIQKIIGLGKTALSHHLRNLGDNGLIKQLHRGIYEITQDGISMLDAISAGFGKTLKRKELEALHKANAIRRIYTKEGVAQMKENEIKIVELAPMRVASVRAISSSPENDAWAKMESWALKKGLLENLDKHPLFGFNNPNPEPGKIEYGYEFWIKVDEKTESDEIVNVKEFKGGLYAVKSCNLSKEVASDFFKKNGFLESWYLLDQWVKDSQYQPGEHQSLEKAINPGTTEEELILDLYFPIKEVK